MPISRGVPPALMTAVSNHSFFPVMLVYFDWPGSPVRAHSGRGVINWNGFNWQGVGQFGDVSVPGESMSGVPEEISMSIVTDFPDIGAYTDALVKSRPGQIYIGATNTPGGNDLIDAVELSSGSGDGLALSAEAMEDDNVFLRISLTLRTGPSSRTPTSVVHSDEDQKRFFPEDTAGVHLAFAESNAQRLLWPAP